MIGRPKNPCPLCPEREALIRDLRADLAKAHDRIIALTDKAAYRQLYPPSPKRQDTEAPQVPLVFSPSELRNTVYSPAVDPALDSEFQRVEEMEGK